MSLGRKLPFALLKLELWRCWREHCGCEYASHFVDQDEGDGLYCRPAFETGSCYYYRGDRYYAGYTTNSFEVLGEVFFLTSFLALKQFWNRWPGFLQCDQVTTAEGDDVTTIAYSRPFAVREGLFRIALFAYILRIVNTARSSVKSLSALALYYICRYSSVSHSNAMSSMLSSLNTSPMSTSPSRK